MKILMVIRYNSVPNPYVNSLVNGLINFGHDVKCDLDLFWNSFNDFDLLFFQWPEAIFEWERNSIDLQKLSEHFEKIRKAHIKMIITCHNLRPHNKDKKTVELYNLVYSKVDAFHHMGNYSYEKLKKRFPHQYHFIAPHHVADSLWEYSINSIDAKRALHIPKDNIVISSFGEFRNTDEVHLFLDMAKDVSNRHISFLAPRLPIGRIYNGRWINKSIKNLYLLILYKKLGIKYSGFLSNEELKVWLSASDVVFIQRKEILNSGNVPLAFSASKIVVGPNQGNVGAILKETDNFIFEPYDKASVKKAVIDAISTVRQNSQLGFNNFQYAMRNWSTKRICGLINEVISIIINNK